MHPTDPHTSFTISGNTPSHFRKEHFNDSVSMEGGRGGGERGEERGGGVDGGGRGCTAAALTIRMVKDFFLFFLSEVSRSYSASTMVLNRFSLAFLQE